jgi:hypothetical protein
MDLEVDTDRMNEELVRHVRRGGALDFAELLRLDAHRGGGFVTGTPRLLDALRARAGV